MLEKIEVIKTSFTVLSWQYTLSQYKDIAEKDRTRRFTLSGQLFGGTMDAKGNVTGVTLALMCSDLSNNTSYLHNLTGRYSWVLPHKEYLRVQEFAEKLLNTRLPNDLSDKKLGMIHLVRDQVWGPEWKEHLSRLKNRADFGSL